MVSHLLEKAKQRGMKLAFLITLEKSQAFYREQGFLSVTLENVRQRVAASELPKELLFEFLIGSFVANAFVSQQIVIMQKDLQSGT